MMDGLDALQLAVDAPRRGIRVVRVAGELNRATARRLTTLANKQLARLEAGGSGHVIVDLAGVRFFGAGGLEALTAVHDAARRIGVRLYVTGLSDHLPQLPQHVGTLLARFSMFPTVEQALRDIATRPLAARPRAR